MNGIFNYQVPGQKAQVNQAQPKLSSLRLSRNYPLRVNNLKSRQTGRCLLHLMLLLRFCRY